MCFYLFQIDAFRNMRRTDLDAHHIDAGRNVLPGNLDAVRSRIHDIRDVGDFITKHGIKANVHYASAGNRKRHLEHIASGRNRSEAL